VTSTQYWLYCVIAKPSAVSELQATVTATNTVLDRLGKEVADIVRYYLRNNFAICLEPDCLFAVEEIGIALQRLVGENEARSIIQEIRQEIMDLDAMQKRTTRQRKGAFTFWVSE
jgi:hypothetical protein